VRVMQWLVKSDPETYGFDELARDKQTCWDGVTNPVALKNLRGMSVGDVVFVYHSGAQKTVVGRAEVLRAAYPDPKRPQEERIVVVDLRAKERLKTPVTLAELKGDPAFKDSPLLRQGRLSVVPLTEAQARVIERRASQ
jgi:predicted RNA-binding protein with PUA-like domain